MSGDYKWDIQMIAEEIAEKQFGCDFYDLSPETQYSTYKNAQEEYASRLADKADQLRDEERERG